MTSRPIALGLLGAAAAAAFASSSRGSTSLGVVALASVAAVFAVQPRGRPLLGVTLVAVAVAVGVALMPESPLDPLVLVMVAALAGAGLVVAIRGRRWPALSRRYDPVDAPANAPANAGVEDLWRALDRGEDPTVRDAPGATADEEAERRPPVD
jgi:hypothetical protein